MGELQPGKLHIRCKCHDALHCGACTDAITSQRKRNPLQESFVDRRQLFAPRRDGFAELSDAHVKSGDREQAAAAIKRARELAATSADIARKAKALGVI